MYVFNRKKKLHVNPMYVQASKKNCEKLPIGLFLLILLVVTYFYLTYLKPTYIYLLFN